MASARALPNGLKAAELQTLALLVKLLRSGNAELTALLEIATKSSEGRNNGGSKTAKASGSEAPAARKTGWTDVEKKSSRPSTGGPSSSTAAPAGAATRPSEQSKKGNDRPGELAEKLIQDGWSVPVRETAEGQKADQAGVFLAPTALVTKIASELTNVKVPLAALTPQRVGPTSTEMIVPVRDSEGVIRRRRRFITQLGNHATPVVFDVPGGATVPASKTRVIVVETCPLWTCTENWTAAAKLPIQAAKRWLQHRAKVKVQDVFNPTKRISKWGTETLQVLARVTGADAVTARDAAGLDGVICRLIMTEEEKAASRIVWLANLELEGALRQKERIAYAQGLVANERGFGVRVPAAKYAEASNTLLGEAPMDIDGKNWEVSGIPFCWSAENLEEAAFNAWGWDCTVVRSRRQGRTRTHFVRAAEAPQREFYQLEDGLAVIRPAGPRPPTAPSKKQRWIPGGELRSDVHWPTMWTDPDREKTLREKAAAKPAKPASPAFGGRVAAVNLPAPAPAAMAAADIASIVRQAVAAAMAPHVAAVEELRDEVMELQGYESDNGAEEASKTAKRPAASPSSGRAARRPRGAA